MLNICFITLIEEYLGEPPHEYEDTYKKSFISVWIQNTTGWSDKVILNICSTIPALNAMVCLWKLRRLYGGALGIGLVENTPSVVSQ
jgi:hypothetical protein